MSDENDKVSKAEEFVPGESETGQLEAGESDAGESDSEESEVWESEAGSSDTESSYTGESEAGESESGEPESLGFEAEEEVSAAEDHDDVRIPGSLGVLLETPEAEGNASEPPPLPKAQEAEKNVETPSSSKESSYGKLSSDESKSSTQDSESLTQDSDSLYAKESDTSVPSPMFLDKIQATKESLQASMTNSLATVKAVLIPVGQEIIRPFRVDSNLSGLKDYFSKLLNIPPDVLQIRYAGKILKSDETLLQHGVKPQDVIHLEIFSAQPDMFQVRTVHELDQDTKFIMVRIQTGVFEYQEVAVEIEKSNFHKPFLGGFRHKLTGQEYHNAGTQTVPKKIPIKPNIFSRDTQTVKQRKKLIQTTCPASTQMTKIGVYVSNMSDKLITPRKYFTAEEYHARRLNAVIVIQTYYRRWHAKRVVENLRGQKRIKLEWEAEQKEAKKREKEKEIKLDYDRRHHPQTKEDFELLYNALESWRREEISCINQSLTGAERKTALCELLEKETQIIASIERHRRIAVMKRKEIALQDFLKKCEAPKTQRAVDGKIVEVDTQFTIRTKELHSIYNCIILENLSQDERLDVLLTLKHTVKEHECKLTREILELIDREVDLMMRGVKHCNLEGLRKRIATLFFQYIKTPLFNPEVARHLKVPQDPLDFYKKIYFCHSCHLYLPSTDFYVSSTSRHINRCRKCINLENESRQRESFLKYKCLLKRLFYSETCYEDDSKIAFLMQLQDIQYLIENIWSSQSILSSCTDLNKLVMVRWDTSIEWSPWNCILLTKDEGIAHLKLKSIEEGYRPVFIHKIKHKHILAINYFSQVPALASFILKDEEVKDIRKKYREDSKPTTLEARKLTST
ncbi:IQ and ubiquitin-like domain-containing protein [Sorex araneus]|uniref:IQ and ubiquitin-like domain-containing protein n=1 Tax=Sorex araneus TaxID=42254 RepID=UPI002433D51D|nr:IQ and ubiquitin-like domain-containing protein [Sorex araneus]